MKVFPRPNFQSAWWPLECKTFKYQTLLLQPRAQAMQSVLLRTLVGSIFFLLAAVSTEAGLQELTMNSSGFNLISEAGQKSRPWQHKEDKMPINTWKPTLFHSAMMKFSGKLLRMNTALHRYKYWKYIFKMRRYVSGQF